MFTQKTFSIRKEDIKRSWHLIDAEGKVLGRLATQVADLLRGKGKPTFTPNQECGDFVVIVNCEKVVLTGRKMEDKKYHWHTNHIGGLKTRTFREQLDKNPQKILLDAVKGMLPKTTLGRKQLTKLKVFVGPEHSHDAQKPVPLNDKA